MGLTDLVQTFWESPLKMHPLMDTMVIIVILLGEAITRVAIVNITELELELTMMIMLIIHFQASRTTLLLPQITQHLPRVTIQARSRVVKEIGQGNLSLHSPLKVAIIGKVEALEATITTKIGTIITLLLAWLSNISQRQSSSIRMEKLRTSKMKDLRN